MSYVLGFDEIDRTQVASVGGKGAQLGELARIDGIPVPDGFCVTTDAFRRVVAGVPSINDRLDRLTRLRPDDRAEIRTLCAQIRAVIGELPLPEDLVAQITSAVDPAAEHLAYAVRSSATAEDLPTASFAGQHDSFLNVIGSTAVLHHIAQCWASLFTERSVTYRVRHGYDHRKVEMAVVVQRMVLAQASGILFTADPVTSNRKIAVVEAGWGLGESLVSGLVNPDSYQVRGGQIVATTIGTKQSVVGALPAGGTQESPVEPERQRRPVLSGVQVLQLAQLGRRIETHFGHPQDIEWCLVDNEFSIVQSRPITTLFPVPAAGDAENHVYISVGHQQMMTDPMRPLGLSFWQMTTPAPMAEAGGRLFVDVTARLASPASRAGLLEALERADPLTRDALQTILERDDFIAPRPDEGAPGPLLGGGGQAPIATDPAVVTELMEQSETSITALQNDIQAYSGPELFDFIRADLVELKRILFDPRSHQVFMSAMEATWWLNEHLLAWLGEKNAADSLTQSVPHNVTSEMGLALLDVADVIRPHADVVAFLQRVEDSGSTAEDFGDGSFVDGSFFTELGKRAGGQAARDAIRAWLDTYGMRCTGEIDITRPRWSEQPTTIVPMILSNIRNFEPGAAGRRFEQGRQLAQQNEQELLQRLRALPDGESKADEVKPMIDRVRTFIGYREYPKYGMVSRYFVYKLALLAEAERLVRAGVLSERDDIFYLSFDELHDVVRMQQVDGGLIGRRKQAFDSYRALTPPRVLTSDGEAVTGAYRREDVPPGALPGLAVSGGTVDGRARVILDVAHADLAAGDILVTTYTDPSWTTLFVGIAGLVTEVGGLMTHGAVIAREYGLPAVVGVEHATRLIHDGQRIRVHGTAGYVEILAQNRSTRAPGWS